MKGAMYLCLAMILSFLFYAFLAYLAFRLVFNFIIPLYRTTRQVKRGFRDMQERMRPPNQQQQQQQRSSQSQAQPQPKSNAGDYIEFEEIK
jgi:predicted PurR-regulated permease PerM